MSKKKGEPGAQPSKHRLGQWDTTEGEGLTDAARMERCFGALGERIGAGKNYGEQGEKINDLAIPSVEDARMHADLKVQSRDPSPKTVLTQVNALAKIRFMLRWHEGVESLYSIKIGEISMRNDEKTILGQIQQITWTNAEWSDIIQQR